MNLRRIMNNIITKHRTKSQTVGLSIILLLPGMCILPSHLSQTIPQTIVESTATLNGQILYAPMWSTTTYLIENNGMINHTWPSSFIPGVMVRWYGDGTILRTIRVGAGPGSGGAGGGVQKVLWDGTVEWDYRYNADGLLSHHDIRLLPNGNVLMIAWERKTQEETIAAGRNPDTAPSFGLWPDHIIEVKPTGPTNGEIVWEWHVWDHLIQDYDPTKENFGVVEDHPELVDINYGTSWDFMHTNSIDYNEKFDQILISVCYFCEIWVIDHSTTTEEASGHTGGNSGKGGDLLYRWGNPMTYRAGTVDDQKLFFQHDATWVDTGCPGEGNILVFNNDGETRHYSSVDEIIPPINETGKYYLEEGTAFGPENQTWIYTANPPTSFYAGQFSGAHRLTSGNTLICNGESGRLFEVTPECVTVWQYDTGVQLFKVAYIPPGEPPEPDVPKIDCSGSLSWSNIEPGTLVNGSFELQNIGGSNSLLNWTINASSITWGSWTFTPESGENLTPDDGPLTVQVSVVAPDEGNSVFEGYVRVENQNDPTNFDVVFIYLKTPADIHSGHMKIDQFFLKLKPIFFQKIYDLFR